MKRNRHALVSGWLLPGIAAIAVALVLVIWQWPAITGAPEQTPSRAAPVATATDTNGAASSADHVQATAQYANGRLTAYLQIDAGWHVNANPASLEFLIPTEMTLLSQGTPLTARIAYPAGRTLDVGLAQPISVYSDRTKLTAELPAHAADQALTAAIRIQACSDGGRCLMPSTLSIPVTEG